MWSKAASILALASVAVAQSKGFNYGSTNADGRCRGPDDFVHFFNEAKSLPGAPGFNTARLYTSIQCGTPDYPISAFQAAIDTNTTLLVGLWASAGRDVIENELKALLRAARELGPAFTDKVMGISVGSEDLYRSSPQGVANKAGAGATGAEIEGYIARVKDQIRGTGLESKPIGHVDTWTAWVLPENRGVAKAVSWLGHNSFPYFENTRPNAIDEAQANFYAAVGQTESVSDGKPVWITETGWPRLGPKSGSAVASLENSKRYWQEVGCSLFGARNTFWYTLKDANVAQTDISFAITPPQNNTPFFDLTCHK
ncbi:glucan 1,3-beta-glucosidase-like protein [Ampelomyces quisqualis]|uniref:Probable glucan endo-1,3-beta-glucosidase eglC n=1 Tax=Ampelomyces quisqualis TaxID=50730 RepID=A0A6A5Q9U8_AMPQU|nr:glucan 1,3-beta-glucosidase-like protein [Ampelomyces quisqualis]